MDWDRLMANAARGRDFAGRTTQDEQAYFEAFGGDTEPPVEEGVWRTLGHACVALVGFISAGFMLR